MKIPGKMVEHARPESVGDTTGAIKCFIDFVVTA